MKEYIPSIRLPYENRSWEPPPSFRCGRCLQDPAFWERFGGERAIFVERIRPGNLNGNR